MKYSIDEACLIVERMSARLCDVEFVWSLLDDKVPSDIYEELRALHNLYYRFPDIAEFLDLYYDFVFQFDDVDFSQIDDVYGYIMQLADQYKAFYDLLDNKKSKFIHNSREESIYTSLGVFLRTAKKLGLDVNKNCLK